jgi:hypothetical protein
MTWDANIDSTGPDGNAPYAYSLGIQSILYKDKYKKSNIMFNHYNKKNYKKCNLYKLSKKI